MRQRFDDWKTATLEKFKDARIQEIRQHGGLVGAFAWVDTEHVSSWPSWLKPGYQILHPVPGDYA